MYVAALERLRKASELTGKERLRAVALAYKLGEMAETYQLPAEEEERWLVYAVEEMLHVVRDEQAPGPKMSGADEQASQTLNLDELELPSWVDTTDVVVPLQALGTFYSRVGKQE